MRVVIDCNIFVMSLSGKSKYHAIILHLLKGSFNLLVSTEVYFEYAEIITSKYGESTAKLFINALENSPSVIPITPAFKWRLIEFDEDDDKYVDLYIAGLADYLVTEDNHFNILKDKDFPLVTVINLSQFMLLLQQLH